MNLIYFILICFGITQILCFATIFDSIRPKYHFFHCPMCIGFWVGFFVWALSPYTELFNFDYTIINAFICGCISAGTSYLLGMVVNDFGIKVVHKGGES